MATDTAGKWILGLIAYFVLLFVIMTSIYAMQDEYDFDDSSVTFSGGSVGSALSGLGLCEAPSLASIDRIGTYSSDCNRLVKIGSVYDNTSCEYVEGCSWETKSSIIALITLGAFGSTSETCVGEINLTSYNNGVEFDEGGFFRGLGDTVCDVYDLQLNKDTCEFFGCEWVEEDASSVISFKTLKSIWNIFKDVFTFNVRFTGTSTLFNNLLNFIFIILPIIALGIAVVIFARG